MSGDLATDNHTHSPGYRPGYGRGAAVVAFAAGAAIPALLAFTGGGYGTVARSVAGLVVWWGVALMLALEIVPRASISRYGRFALAAFAALCGWIALSAIWTEALDRTLDELARTIGYAGLLALVLLSVNRSTWRAAAAGLWTAALLVCASALANRLAPGVFAETPVQAIFGYERLSFPLDYWNAVGCWASMTFALTLAWSIDARHGWHRALALGALPAVGLVAYLSYSRGTLLSAVAGVIALIVLTPGAHRRRLLATGSVALTGTAMVILVTRATPAIELGDGGEGAWLVLGAILLFAAACVPLAFRGWLVPPRRGLFAPASSTTGSGSAGAGGRGGADRSPFSRDPFVLGPAVALPVAAVLIGLAAAVIGGPQPAEEAPVGVVPEPTEQAPVSPVPDIAGAGLTEAETPERADPAARLGQAGGMRDVLWPSALRAFRSHPATGTGAGTYDIWLARDAPGGEFARNAHSIYLEFAAELGLVGLALLMALFLALGFAALRVQRAADAHADGLGTVGAGLLAAGVVFAVQAGVDWMWESAAIMALAIGCVAVVAAARQSAALEGERPLIRPRTRWIAVALAVVAGAVQIPIAVSSDRYQRAVDAVHSDRVPEAEDRLDEALAFAPWSSEAVALRAVVRLGLDDLEGAREDALTATERVPTLYRYWLALAQIEATRGEMDAAEAALERAAELRPADAEGIERLGREALRTLQEQHRE